MLLPCQNRRAAKYYTGKLCGKIAAKRNSRSSVISPDSHFARAQVQLRKNRDALYPDEIINLSCDNNAKVHVGTLAVNRYHQIRKFNLLKFAPNYNDHDFPDSTKITPSVYLELKHGSLATKMA
ncbi:unnamed protein product [Didymodactylos carnosus]|uniref:Uncharacterized protein n=1 Tax=Didymodactylos carnosus TaxID=1234261 RepID=A0A8S2EY66_9BILA|nr:unnamed protein product [Didymodactylos carnosus]CAF4089049.1 unnamed protein product [Didymodactylos carnosus]